MANTVSTANKGNISTHTNTGLALRSWVKVGAAALSVLTIAGCSSLNIGESDFSCPGMPDGVKCMSTSEVYAATNDGGVPLPMQGNTAQESKYKSETDGGYGNVNDGYTNIVDPVRNPVSAYVAPRLPDQPVPIRTPSQVMRIWVAPWEDTNGDLNVSGYLYTEIEPRRWILGDPAPSSNPVLSPLTVKRPVARNINQSNTAAPLRTSNADQTLTQENTSNSEI